MRRPAALAGALGIEELLILTRDPELDVLLPAPGFAQTIGGGPLWRAFIDGCSTPGRRQGDIDVPQGSVRPATALVAERAVAVLVGPAPIETEVTRFAGLFPMLAALLCAEQEAAFARAAADEARRAATRASALAGALEAARAEGARLNAALREEHRRKDDFLAMLGHELRNPLSPLVSSVDLLRRGGLSHGDAAHSLDIMARQLSQLSRLVDDLLDVSRVSRGRVELRPRPVSLQEVLREALEATRPLLEARKHRVTLSVPPDPLTLHADVVRLTQVFSNLLHNAGKYTDPGGTIEVSAAHENEMAVVRIKDNGIGIPLDMLPRIFDLFSQAPVSLARAQGGLGIGLTLARGLVELHGGTVGAESLGPGMGSTFTVRLPIPLARQSGNAPVAAAAPATGTASAAKRLRVLVVDDNDDAANTLCALVTMLGHECHAAYSGLKALQMVSDLAPDMVVLDIGLPDLDGFEVLRRMRRTASSGVRYVALTGYGSKQDRQRTREAGFDQHIVKPVSLEALSDLLRSTAAAAS